MKALLFASLVLFAGCSKSTEPSPRSPAGPAGMNGAGGTGMPQGGAPEAVEVPAPILAAIAAADRTDDDRKLDAGRKPGPVLAFFHVAPGQKIGELFAGTGYTTELLARTLGDGGKLYTQNTKEDRYAQKPMVARLARPVMKNTVLVERPAEAPLPPEARDLDAVICVLNYHDLVWENVNRTKMNAAVFAALRSGGIYGIVDHSAAAGSGVRDVEKLHRIDEDVVKREVLAAGFKFDGESNALRNPADPRDWNASPGAAGERRGTSDRFVLRFVKP